MLSIYFDASRTKNCSVALTVSAVQISRYKLRMVLILSVVLPADHSFPIVFLRIGCIAESALERSGKGIRIPVGAFSSTGSSVTALTVGN